MENKKSVLVAGGTGFIGKALVRHLLNLGYRVKVMTRNAEKARKQFPPEVQVVQWPSQNEKLLMPKNHNCFAFVNLTGENIGKKRWTINFKQKLSSSRTKSVDNLYQLIQQMENPPKVWIQASAIGFYGAHPSGICTETTPKGNGFLAEITNELESKVMALNLPNTRRVVLRLGIVMHPAGGFLNTILKGIAPGLKACPGNGQNTLSWIHLTDLIRLIETSIEEPDYNGVINATAPVSVTLKAILKMEQKFGFVLPVPSFLLKLALGAQKANELVLSNQNVYPAVLMQKKFGFIYPEFVPEMLKT